MRTTALRSTDARLPCSVAGSIPRRHLKERVEVNDATDSESTEPVSVRPADDKTVIGRSRLVCTSCHVCGSKRREAHHERGLRKIMRAPDQPEHRLLVA